MSRNVEDSQWLKEYFEGEDYSDYPQFKDMINTWNNAQDAIGIKQSLWVLRITMGWHKSLTTMPPEMYPKLIRLLRVKYAELVKAGKIEKKSK